MTINSQVMLEKPSSVAELKQLLGCFYFPNSSEFSIDTYERILGRGRH